MVMEKSETFYRQKKFHGFVSKTFSKLIQLKKEEKKEAFNELILKSLPSIKKYINGRLEAAVKKGHFPKNKYRADEFIDQLFIEVYDNIDEVQIAEDFYLWLFKRTDQLLEDAIVAEEFDDLFLKDIDDYSKPERDEMDEQFSTDGDGDLVMIDELDDISYNKNEYTLHHVFIEDDEQDYIDKLDKELSEAEVKKQIHKILYKLPIQTQSVFELYATHQFNIEEVAKIKQMDVAEATRLLQDARNTIRTSLLNG